VLKRFEREVVPQVDGTDTHAPRERREAAGFERPFLDPLVDRMSRSCAAAAAPRDQLARDVRAGP